MELTSYKRASGQDDDHQFVRNVRICFNKIKYNNAHLLLGIDEEALLRSNLNMLKRILRRNPTDRLASLKI